MGKVQPFSTGLFSLDEERHIFQGTKLWIIMEYLGGGSALDLVSVFKLTDISFAGQSFRFLILHQMCHLVGLMFV